MWGCILDVVFYELLIFPRLWQCRNFIENCPRTKGSIMTPTRLHSKIDSQNKYWHANQGIKSARAGSEKKRKIKVAGTCAFMGFGGSSWGYAGYERCVVVFLFLILCTWAPVLCFILLISTCQNLGEICSIVQIGLVIQSQHGRRLFLRQVPTHRPPESVLAGGWGWWRLMWRALAPDWLMIFAVMTAEQLSIIGSRLQLCECR